MLEGERVTADGNIIALACGPLRKKRYINPKIEQELVEFKKEIEEKYEKSPLRRFVMPKAEAPPEVAVQSRPIRNRAVAQSTDIALMQ